jgi:hypothetical protein
VEEIVKGLGSSTGGFHGRLNAGLSAGQLATTDAVIALIRATVFPAFEYALYSHDESYERVRPALQESMSLWQRLREPLPTQRAAKLRELRDRHNLRSDEDAVELATKGLKALEGYLLHAGVSTGASRSTDGTTHPLDACPFFHGTTVPSTTDCFVYAAIAVAAASRFPSSSAWAAFQVDSGLTLDTDDEATNGVPAPARKSAFPLLCFYGRSIARRYFEQYAGLHFVNLPAIDVKVEDSDPYRAGRRRIIIGTALFAFTYMVMVNAKSILETLLAAAEYAEAVEAAEEEAEEGGEEVVPPEVHPAAGGAAPQGH